MNKTENRFLTATIMGKNIFMIYKNKTDNIELKNLLNESIKIFKKQEENIINEIKILNDIPNNNLLISQNLAIILEKIKIKMIKNDFLLIMRIIKVLNTGINGSYKLFFNNKNSFSNSFNNIIKKNINENELLEIKYKNLLKELAK